MHTKADFIRDTRKFLVDASYVGLPDFQLYRDSVEFYLEQYVLTDNPCFARRVFAEIHGIAKRFSP